MFFQIVYDIVRQHGGLCIADEVQGGFGRTGAHYWAHQNWGVKPDLITMAKGIGNGVPPWRRLFHSMRATRQTELQARFPRHVVCAWMGNSSAIAEQHYLLVRDEDFATASADEPVKKAARNPAQSTRIPARKVAP